MTAGVLLLIGLCMLAAPGGARTIANGDTVFDCETDLNISAVAEDGDCLVNYLYDDPELAELFSIPVDDAAALDLSPFRDDLKMRHGTYYVRHDGVVQETNKINILSPEVSLNVCLDAGTLISVSERTVKNTTPIAFTFVAVHVGTYLPTAAVRVELTTPDGGIVTGIPDANGTVRDLTNIALSAPWVRLRNIDINRLESGVYTGQAVWESPQDFADYAPDSNCVKFTVTDEAVTVTASKENLIRNGPFFLTVNGDPETEYYLYVRDAAVAPDRYPYIKAGQPSVTIADDAFAGAADPDADTLANSERATAGGAYAPGTAAVLATGTIGIRSVEFGTTTNTTPSTYVVTVLDPADASKRGDVNVTVEEGEVTITAEGAGTYYLGETLKISGTNTDNRYTYLFITGRSLGDGGVVPDNLSACASAGNYVRRPVESDDTWEYRWDTDALGRAGQILDPATYTVYACGNCVDEQGNNIDKYHLSGVQYQTFSVYLKAPVVSLDGIEAVVAKGDPLTIGGTTAGDPDQVKLWIFGENYRLFGVNVPVEDDGTFAYTIGRNETPSLYSGRYYVVVQHPMADCIFNVFPFAPGSTTDFRIANTWSSDVVDLGPLAPSEAADALANRIRSQICDDVCYRTSTDVEEPWIAIDPVADHAVGETFTVAGSTNLAVGDRLFFEVVRASFDPTDPGDEPGYGASGNTTVRAGAGTNEWSFEVDTAKFNAEAYRVFVESVDADVTESTTFSLDNPGGARAAFTASPTMGVAPLTVRFADLSTNASVWVWTFGDGNTSADQNPTHTYTEGGNYTVVLSVNGGAGVANATITVLPVLFGDANDNGVIDQADTLRVLKQVVGMAAMPAAGTERFRKTDVHRNGEIEIGDALFIAQYNVGLRGPWFGMMG